MGTYFRVVHVLDEHSVVDPALAESIQHELDRLNGLLSHYDPDSEVSVFSSFPANQAMLISDELAQVLRVSLEVYQQSQRAFDVTLAPVIDAWGFGPKGEITRAPSASELTALKARVGSDKLVLDGNRLTKQHPETSLNLSAVAKGYAVASLSRWLHQRGLMNHMVDIGGEIAVRGTNADGKLWRVGIETPHIAGGVEAVVELDNQAIATSGDYRNYLELDGQRFSHTIDAFSFQPVYHRLASVSILHESATKADAWATAIMVLGDEQGLALADALELDYYALIRTESDVLTARWSNGFDERLLK